VYSLPQELVYEPFPSNDMTDTHTDTQAGGFMKYAVKEGQVPMVYTARFKGISSSILKFMGEAHRYTSRMEIAVLISFRQNEKSKPKIKKNFR
jgi:hypothetical protein